MTRFAAKTTVSTEKSRAEIERLDRAAAIRARGEEKGQ